MKLQEQKVGAKVLIYLGEGMEEVTVIEHLSDRTKIDNGEIFISCWGDSTCYKAYKREHVGTTKIDVSGKELTVGIYRNKFGNLETVIDDVEKHFPNGTSLSGYNDEVVISEYTMN